MVLITYPLKQGLKPALEISWDVDNKVLITYPLKQGLKPNKSSNFPLSKCGGSNYLSTKTRIETKTRPTGETIKAGSNYLSTKTRIETINFKS
ncbi:hypothetical protein GMMP13_1650019 [Candidatus Magnetomoraceae bacterium gMMP-13]